MNGLKYSPLWLSFELCLHSRIPFNLVSLNRRKPKKPSIFRLLMIEAFFFRLPFLVGVRSLTHLRNAKNNFKIIFAVRQCSDARSEYF